MGKAENLVGQTFGLLTVLERDYAYEQTLPFKRPSWKCRCQCGNIVTRKAINLKTAKLPSCGCYQLIRENKIDNLIGKKFGYLTVVERNDKYYEEHRKQSKDRGTYWTCQCDCGNTCVRSSDTLKRKGLHQCDNCTLPSVDLTGQQFGKLTVLYFNGRNANNRPIWHCKCACGKEIDTDIIHSIYSCGCITQSNGEYEIEQILIKNNINYIYDKSYFQDLRSSDGYLLRYDFILFENNEPYRIIEFDGEQHYDSSDNYYTPKLWENDMIKNKYAIEHNIPLVRIPYSQIHRITLNTLLGDKFIIKDTPEAWRLK